MYIAASVDKNNKALVSHFTLAGVEKELSQQFSKQFMESVTWN